MISDFPSCNLVHLRGKKVLQKQMKGRWGEYFSVQKKEKKIKKNKKMGSRRTSSQLIENLNCMKAYPLSDKVSLTIAGNTAVHFFLFLLKDLSRIQH